jgi:periplasmic protein CpxP/Spy
MTRIKTLSLASAVLAAALAAAPLTAQQTATPPSGPPPGGMGHHGPMMGGHMMGGHMNAPSVDERVQRMSGELSLTPEQTARVKALMTAEQRSADSLRAVRAVQMEAERKAMDARHAEHEKAIMAILTPEQKTKHEALMKERESRGPGMRGHGMRGHGGAPTGGPGEHRGRGDEDGAQR